MTDATNLTTAKDPYYNRIQTRRRREERADQTFEVTIGERTTIKCDNCRESYELLVAGASDKVSYGPCSTWDCDSFHKRVLEQPESEPKPSETVADDQANLSTFAGGESG